MPDIRGAARPQSQRLEADPAPRVTPGLEAMVTERLAERLGPREFEAWFGHSTTLRLREHTLEVSTNSAVAASWIADHCSRALEQITREVVGHDVAVSIIRAPERSPASRADERAARSRPALTLAEGAHPGSPDTDRSVPRGRQTNGSGSHALPLRYRLDDFVVGPCNLLAYGAAERVAEDSEAVGLNALFLFGECGVGKTHLLQGACRRFMERFPGTRVRYTTGEQFTNEFIASVRNNTVDQFRKRLRQADLLAIDDVHFLANKAQTQSEFLHTLDVIDLGGARIVLASDEHPTHIQSFSQKLISRFMKGMVVEMERPDRRTRAEIIRRLALARGMRLNEAAVEMIVTNCLGSVREIEGAVTKLAALRLVSGGLSDSNEVGAVLVERLFQDRPLTRSPLRVATILEVVCRRLGVERSELLGSGRHRRVVLARGLVSYLARELTTLSYPEIARAIGRSNHSTVLTAGRRLHEQLERGERIELDPQAGSMPLKELVDHLRHELTRHGRSAA